MSAWELSLCCSEAITHCRSGQFLLASPGFSGRYLLRHSYTDMLDQEIK